MRSAIWFRNDLRVFDNPALSHCCANSEEVIAIYIISPTQWENHHDAKVKISLWIRSLLSLQKELEKLNIPLLILESNKYQNISSDLYDLLKEKNCKNLYFNNEYPVNELKRDRSIYKEFKEKDIGVFTFHDQVIHPPGTLKTKAGGNFSVYSPF